ncbi:hypothetical protein [Marivirga sp.]|uniref:hypothetical protein n=1 Tax=Marivirga sp. TaxID=2018662 RepID=UPI003DA78ACD
MRRFVIIGLFYLLSGSVFSQVNNEIVLDDLKSPTFPASIIIGTEANSIARPTDRNAVTTSLLSALSKDGIAPNVAMEISPFWLSKRPNLTFQDYIEPSSISDAIRQTFGISIATDEIDGIADGRKLGLGLRAQLFPGRTSQLARNIIAGIQYENVVNTLINGALSLPNINTPEDLVSGVKNLINQALSGNVSLGPIAGLTQTQVLDFLSNDALNTTKEIIKNNNRNAGESMNDYVQRLIDIISNSSITNAITLQGELKNRVGLIVEGALASRIDFPTNEFDNEKFNQFGGWGTVTYRPDNQYGDATFLLRYMKSYRDSISTNLDVGLRVDRTTKDFVLGFEGIFRSAEIEFEDFNLNNEPITRIESNDSFRFTFNLDYKLTSSIFLNATIGKDFSSALTGSGGLLTLFGFNFGIPANKTMLIR